jgi:hypothetical protein
MQHITLGDEQKKLGYPTEPDYLTAHPEQVNWTQTERLKFMRGQAVRILKAHPWIYLRSHIAGVGVVAFTPCATELLQLFRAYPIDDAMPHRIVNEGIVHSLERVFLHHPGVMLAMCILEVILLSMYLLAMRACLACRLKNLALLTVGCVVLYFLIISGGAQAVGRYRLPVMPLLCVLAAGGLASSPKAKLRSHGGSAVEVV